MVRLSPAILLACAYTQADAKKQSADVIVVGAGYSGIAAARELHRSGLSTIVLEGRNYVGGRTATKEFHGINFDYGGAYMQGGTDNPLQALSSDYGFTPAKIDWVTAAWDFDFNQFPSSGSESYDNVAYKPYNTAYGNARRQLGRSLYEAFEEGKNWDGVDKKRFNSTLAYDVESGYGGPAYSMDSSSYREYYCGFRWRYDTYYPEGGFGHMVETIAAQEALDIQLNTAVTEVADNGDSVTVTTENGDVYTASNVVVTATLGNLKAGDILFTPQLNNDKKIAIDRIEMATCNKVFMAFDEENFAGSPWAQQGLEYFNNESPFDEAPFYFYNRQIHPFSGGSPIIESWWCSNLEMEYNNGVSLQRHLDVLRNIYPELSDPIDVDYTDWNQNRFSRGSYSYPGVGSPITDYDNLAKPQGNIHFAGEHTTRSFSSVNGAWLSGLDAADEILRGRTTTPRPGSWKSAEDGLQEEGGRGKPPVHRPRGL